MKTRFIALLFLSLCSLSPLGAQDTFEATEPQWKQLNHAHGFLLAQQASLELIQRQFPDLARDVKEAWFAFNATALGESGSGVEDELARHLGEKWPEFQEQAAAHIHDNFTNQEITLQQATEFLAEVRRRAKGEMPEAIRSTLLAANPRYSRNPALELSEGWKRTFRSKDHPKAKGVDFSISTPASWNQREDNYPNVIQTFRSISGNGPVACSVMVTLPFPDGYIPTKEEWNEFFQSDELKSMVPDAGQFLTAQEMVLDGAPAGMLVFDATLQRLDVEIPVRSTHFVTGHENSMISIQFTVSKRPDSEETLDQLQQKFLPAFKLIANTFILNSRYN